MHNTPHKQKKRPPLGRRVPACLVLCFCAAALLPVAAHAEGMDAGAAPAMLTEDHYALPGFASPLPLLVVELPVDTLATDPEGYFLEAQVQCYEGAEENTLAGEPALTLAAELRNVTDKTNKSGTGHKSDYYLRMQEPQSLLGLGVAGEYLLLGGAKDKSLLRNALGYALAAQVVPGAPGSQLCEVFFRTGGGELYQGVYLLAEVPRREGAVLFHRNTTGEGIPIDTYSTENDPPAGYITIPFMESTGWDDRLGGPIGQLSLAESVLYSTEPSNFYKYPQWFDVPSFEASFVLGELTENYAGMGDAYYCYDPATGKVAAAPLWNFEEALDNRAADPADPDRIRYQEAPYYELFFKSPQFVREVQGVYLNARKTVLNEEALEKLVNDAAAAVAPAQKRDWARWDDYAAHALLPLAGVEDEDGIVTAVEPFSRQSATWGEELLRIRVQLRRHNLSMALELTQFDFSEREISREIVLNTSPVWLVLFLVAFFGLVRFARRYGV